MTKKHFIALANVMRRLNGNYYESNEEQFVDTVSDLADFCTEQNPRFNRERWIAYINGECGPSGGKIK
jgi:hypothetical protein